jgi:hypothetical protein
VSTFPTRPRRLYGRQRVVVLLIALLLLGAQGCRNQTAPPEPQAPAFTLPSALGGEVSLRDYLGQQPVLLYFHMAYG